MALLTKSASWLMPNHLGANPQIGIIQQFEQVNNLFGKLDNVITVLLPNGMYKLTLRANMKNLLIDEFGQDTDKWVFRRINLHTEMDVIKQKEVIIIRPIK
jgi:hypothetical protein